MPKMMFAIGLLLLNFVIMLGVTLFAPDSSAEEESEWEYSVDDERLD